MSFESPQRELNVEPRWQGRKGKHARTPIANGTKLIMADARSHWAKRFTEICSAHCRDLGGFENLSQAELAIIKRAATLQVELENQETRLANGDSKGFDISTFAQVSNGMRRLLETLGIKRLARDVSPTLNDIISRHSSESSFIDAEREQSRADEMLEEGRDSRVDETPESKNEEQAPVGDAPESINAGQPSVDSVDDVTAPAPEHPANVERSE